ncbi:MAG: hypothetical protein K6F15_07960 [Treponema sp.]|nr:hypothetical protein [Treponema sp.]
MSRILNTLRENFFTAIKIIILVILCLLSGFIISFPFWKFATTNPKMYTICALSLISIFAIFYIVKNFRAMSVKKAAKILINFFIIAAGTAGIIILILNELRIISLLLLLAILFLCFLTNMLLYEKKVD